MGKVSREVGVDVAVQPLRGTAPVGPLDVLHNILPQQLNGLCCIEDGEVHCFQLCAYDSPQQVQSVVTLTFSNAPGSHF
mgnify:CR=1 FL=1